VLVAVIRDGHARPPDPDGTLETGDELLFVTAQDYERELAEMLSPRGEVRSVPGAGAVRS
jgi:trk system potassium uptake protein TrkA